MFANIGYIIMRGNHPQKQKPKTTSDVAPCERGEKRGKRGEGEEGETNEL